MSEPKQPSTAGADLREAIRQGIDFYGRNDSDSPYVSLEDAIYAFISKIAHTESLAAPRDEQERFPSPLPTSKDWNVEYSAPLDTPAPRIEDGLREDLGKLGAYAHELADLISCNQTSREQIHNRIRALAATPKENAK